MGLRFRRAVKLLPGVRINPTRRGVSTTVGRRGRHATMHDRQVTNAIGIAGGGLSFSSTTSVPRSADASRSRPGRTGALLGLLALALAVAGYENAAPVMGTMFMFVGAFFALPYLAALFS